MQYWNDILKSVCKTQVGTVFAVPALLSRYRKFQLSSPLLHDNCHIPFYQPPLNIAAKEWVFQIATTYSTVTASSIGTVCRS